MNKIQHLLNQMFSNDAIKAGAICAQLEDVRYCTEHGMNHLNGGKEKQAWEKSMALANRLCEADNGKTFKKENMESFRNAVNKTLKEYPKLTLYDGLTETERFAVRYFYYHNTH